MTQSFTKIEDEDPEQEAEEVPSRYSITSYGADYPVDGLVKRLSVDDIHIPEFQRQYVWNLRQASRFVESLLLGLPVPGIFLSKDQESQKLVVIDGQQRLRTLQYYYRGIFDPSGRAFSVSLEDSIFNGFTYDKLSKEDRRRLDDSIIHATIVKQDEPSDDQSSVYKIFERLNTGGLVLTPQEIRASIFQGEFNNLLRELNQNTHWRLLFGPPNTRMRDQELILRFFALYFRASTYDRPMKEFLNKFMGTNKRLKLFSKDQLKKAFEPTAKLIQEDFGLSAFRRVTSTSSSGVFNAAVFDSVMIGVARRLEHGPVKDVSAMKKSHSDLLNSAAFVDVTGKSTADKDNVKVRLDLATNAFADIK
jgi:uncharacterized protein with ParB-like and HNH nuclease domain